MSEQAKYNVSNALGIGTQAAKAVVTGNYTGIANTLTNSLVNEIQGKALKSANGTVVGYVMNELGNLGYVNGTLTNGPIQTASFAGSLVNAATTAVTSPVSFATSLVKNAAGSVLGVDFDSNTLANAKAAYNGITQIPSQVTNGVQNLANSLATSIGLGSSATSNNASNANVTSTASTTATSTTASSIAAAPASLTGASYTASNYYNSSSGSGLSTGITTLNTTGTGNSTSLSDSGSTTPASPAYANSSSQYSSTPYQTGASYSSETGSYSSLDYLTDSGFTANNSTDRQKTNNDDNYYATLLKDANTLINDEFARCSKNANDSTGRRSLAAFLQHIDNFGVLLQNNFEVEFSGIDGLVLFVTNFEIPGSKQNTCEVYYDGIKITIPVNYEHEHEFSMTLMNDAKGFIYSTIKSYIEMDSYNHYTDPGSTMLVRALTGQVPAAYGGSRIFAKGVRLTSMSGLSYGQGNNEIQTFTVQGTLIEYSHLPLSLSKRK